MRADALHLGTWTISSFRSMTWNANLRKFLLDMTYSLVEVIAAEMTGTPRQQQNTLRPQQDLRYPELLKVTYPATIASKSGPLPTRSPKKSP